MRLAATASMSNLLADFRYATRALLKTPAFVLGAVLILALGTGVNVAVMGLVDQILLRPLPYTDADRLVAVFEHVVSRGERRNPTSPATFLDWQRGASSLEHMTAARPQARVLRGDGAPIEIPALAATPSLFRLLEAKPLLGRLFDPSDDAQRAVAVLSYDLWQRRFGGEESVVGRILDLDGIPHEVIGVMPRGFAFPPFWATESQMWVPLAFDGEIVNSRNARFLRVFARLKDGVGVDTAANELRALSVAIASQDPEAMGGVEANVEPLLDPVVGNVRTAMWLIFGAVTCVLLLACSNVGNLILVRNLGRRRELSLRRALGASRRHLLRLVAIESLLLAAAGTGVGLLLVWWLLDAATALAADSLPRIASVAVDARLVAYAAVISLVAVALFGVLPLLRLLRGTSAGALVSSTGGTVSAPGGQQRVRRFVVIAQLAVAITLVVGAGLLAGSLFRLHRTDPGFAATELLAVPVSFAGASFTNTEHGENAAAQTRMIRELESVARAERGVRAAAFADQSPIVDDLWRTPFSVDGATAPSGAEDKPKAAIRAVSDAYFETLVIARLEGRVFDSRDAAADAARVVIVNRRLASDFFGDKSAVGGQLRLGASGASRVTIIGVVEDAAQLRLRDGVMPEIYFPYAQNPNSWWRRATLLVRSEGPPTDLAPALVASLQQRSGDLALGSPQSLAEAIRASLGNERFETLALALFASLGLVLATVGLYALMSFLVRERRGDLGLRMVVGARRSQILAMILGEAMRLVLGGLVLGLVAAAMLARLYAGLVHDTSVHDPRTYLAAVGVLLISAALAAGLPAWRASRLDPIESLRRAP